MNRIKTAISFFLMIVATSCVGEIDFRPEYVRKLTINGVLRLNESTQVVDIKYNAPRNGTYAEVSEAEVLLYADGLLVGPFKKTAFCRWEIECVPKSGVHYRIEVIVPGLPVVSGETMMPYPPKIERGRPNGRDIRNLIQREGVSSPMWMCTLLRRDSYVADKEIPEDYMDSYLISRSIATNHPYVDNFNITGSSFPRQGTALPSENPDHDGFIRLPSMTLDESLEFGIEGFFDNTILSVMSISEEYDRYLKSSYQKMINYKTGAFYDFLEEDVIYSNINGGLGIFGACSEKLLLYNKYVQ